MAAFENISKFNLQPFGDRSAVDIRKAKWPRSTITDDFEPRDHRNPPNPIPPWMAYLNLLRSLFGAGMLGMPLAVSQAGIVLGPMLIFFGGLLLIHMNLTLLACLNEIAHQLHIPHISYRYGFRLALLHGPPCFRCIGRRGPTIIAVFMVMSQLGICTVFVTFTSDSLRDIMDWKSSKTSLTVLFIPYLILELSMKSLQIVSYVSMLGNVLNTLGLSLVFYQIFNDPHGETVTTATEAVPIMFAFGTVLFNLCCVGVVLSLDKALKNPRVMSKPFGIITVGLGVPTIVSIIFGTLGYWSFGAMDENILRSLAFDETVSLVAIGFYLVAVALAFPIQCYPAIQIILEVYKHHSHDSSPSTKSLKIIEWISRPIFVMTAFLTCYFIPFQGPFVAFVGNLCTTVLALIFPAMMELSILYPSKYGKYNIYLYKNIIVIFIGSMSWLFGVVLCGYLIYIRIISESDLD